MKVLSCICAQDTEANEFLLPAGYSGKTIIPENYFRWNYAVFAINVIICWFLIRQQPD